MRGSALSRRPHWRVLSTVAFMSADREAEYPCPLAVRSQSLWNSGRRVGTQAAIMTMFCSTLVQVRSLLKKNALCNAVNLQAPKDEGDRMVHFGS